MPSPETEEAEMQSMFNEVMTSDGARMPGGGGGSQRSHGGGGRSVRSLPGRQLSVKTSPQKPQRTPTPLFHTNNDASSLDGSSDDSASSGGGGKMRNRDHRSTKKKARKKDAPPLRPRPLSATRATASAHLSSTPKPRAMDKEKHRRGSNAVAEKHQGKQRRTSNNAVFPVAGDHYAQRHRLSDASSSLVNSVANSAADPNDDAASDLDSLLDADARFVAKLVFG